MKYVLGVHPKEGGLEWCDAWEIFGIAFIAGYQHWVAYKIELEYKMIIVYDSAFIMVPWESVKAVFSNLRKFLPLALQHARKSNAKFARFEPFEEFGIEQYKYTSQQQTNYDCGIMAFKNIECLASEVPVYKIDGDHCSTYRKVACAQLFHTKGPFNTKGESAGSVDLL